MELFESAGYSWWGRLQLTFLSAPGSPPPAIDRRELRVVFDSVEDNWVEHTAELADRTGLLAMMCPGHDGAYVGIFSATASFQRRLLKALEETATQAGFGWVSVTTEEAFVDCLAWKRAG